MKTTLEIDPPTVEDFFFQVYGFYPEPLERWIETLEFGIGDCYQHPLMDIIMQIDGVAYEETLQDLKVMAGF